MNVALNSLVITVIWAYLLLEASFNLQRSPVALCARSPSWTVNWRLTGARWNILELGLQTQSQWVPPPPAHRQWWSSCVVQRQQLSVAAGTRRILHQPLIAFQWARLASPGESTILFVPLILTGLINCHGNRRDRWCSGAVGPSIIGHKHRGWSSTHRRCREGSDLKGFGITMSAVPLLNMICELIVMSSESCFSAKTSIWT